MAEQDRIDNANKACLGAGVNTIDSFSDGTAESIFCNEWYEIIVESELSLYPWQFATETKDLSTSRLSGDVDTKWNTAYQAPIGVIAVDTVLIDDTPIEYGRHKDQIHTNDTGNDIPILQYRVRADESLWSPYFKMLVIYRLATMLSFSVSRKADIAGEMKGLADEHWRRAKTMDAQSQTNRKVNLTRIVKRRGSRLDKFWRNR